MTEAPETPAPVASGAAIRDGIKAAWPICLGYLPVGLAFGVLAQKAGLSPLGTGIMSLLVFAGSSQFIAVSMIASGAPFIAIVLTTCVVNSRHLLLSSSLSVFLTGKSKRFLSVFAYGLTDETFAVNLVRYRDGEWDGARAMTVNFISCGGWAASTVLGAVSGEFIPPGAFGIDYALIAMFLCLIVFQLRGRVYLFTALAAGLLATLLARWIPGNLNVLVAALVATTAGFFLRRKLQKGPARERA